MEVSLQNKLANKGMKCINILQLCKTWLNESRQWLFIGAKNHKGIQIPHDSYQKYISPSIKYSLLSHP